MQSRINLKKEMATITQILEEKNQELKKVFRLDILKRYFLMVLKEKI